MPKCNFTYCSQISLKCYELLLKTNLEKNFQTDVNFYPSRCPIYSMRVLPPCQANLKEHLYYANIISTAADGPYSGDAETRWDLWYLRDSPGDGAMKPGGRSSGARPCGMQKAAPLIKRAAF